MGLYTGLTPRRGIWQYPSELQMHKLSGPAIPLLGFSSPETPASLRNDTCTKRPAAVIFIIVKHNKETS